MKITEELKFEVERLGRIKFKGGEELRYSDKFYTQNFEFEYKTENGKTTISSNNLDMIIRYAKDNKLEIDEEEHFFDFNKDVLNNYNILIERAGLLRG